MSIVAIPKTKSKTSPKDKTKAKILTKTRGKMREMKTSNPPNLASRSRKEQIQLPTETTAKAPKMTELITTMLTGSLLGSSRLSSKKVSRLPGQVLRWAKKMRNMMRKFRPELSNIVKFQKIRAGF